MHVAIASASTRSPARPAVHMELYSAGLFSWNEELINQPRYGGAAARHGVDPDAVSEENRCSEEGGKMFQAVNGLVFNENISWRLDE